MINECGNAGHKIHSRKNIKKHKHFCYESQVQSMPGAKMGGSFVSPHGGWVGGVRFIWLWLLKWKKIAIKNMIICLQIWGHWYDVWRELSTEFIGFTPRWVGGWVGSWGKWAAGCDSLQAPKVQEATSKSKTLKVESKKYPKVPTTGYPPPALERESCARGFRGCARQMIHCNPQIRAHALKSV